MTDLPANSIKPIRSPLSEWQKNSLGNCLKVSLLHLFCQIPQFYQLNPTSELYFSQLDCLIGLIIQKKEPHLAYLMLCYQVSAKTDALFCLQHVGKAKPFKRAENLVVTDLLEVPFVTSQSDYIRNCTFSMYTFWKVEQAKKYIIFISGRVSWRIFSNKLWKHPALLQWSFHVQDRLIASFKPPACIGE